jgi:pimeloyl-ACP methyl ester carboxylesterase
MADDLIAVMDAVGLERADLMGYSMGTRMSLSLLSRKSERFSSAVVGGGGLRNRASEPGPRAALAAILEADDASLIADDAARDMRRSVESRGNDLQALAAMQRSDGTTPPSESALRQLALPVLVVVGDQDPALGPARELADIIPRARLEIVPGTDHVQTITAPNYKRAVAEFLAEVSPVPRREAVEPS